MVKKYIIYLILCFVCCYCNSISAQTTNYNSIGWFDSRGGIWVKEDSKVTINFNDSTIITKDEKLDILDRSRWIRKRKSEYITIFCTDSKFNKVFVRFYRYYNGKIIIYVIRYGCWTKYYIP